MSNSAMKLQEYMEDAVVDIMQARTNVLTVDVRRWLETATFQGNQSIIVQCIQRRLEPNYPLFVVELRIGVQTKGEEDLGGKRQDLLYAECTGEIQQDLTVVTLQSAVDAAHFASGIIISGLVPAESGIGAEDDIFYRYETTNVYVEYTQPST